MDKDSGLFGKISYSLAGSLFNYILIYLSNKKHESIQGSMQQILPSTKVESSKF